MNIPIPNMAITPIFAALAISVLVASWLVFLYATWEQYQRDRKHRASVIDDILERIPPRVAEGTAE